MSARLMIWALELDLPEGLKLLLIALARYAGEDGSNVYPSIETLSATLRMHRRTIERRLAELRARGLLEVESPGGGKGRSTHYRLRAGTPAPVSGFATTSTPTPVSPNPDTAVAETPTPAPGERIRESSERGSSFSLRPQEDERPDVAALRSRGWKVTAAQVRILDEIADRHDDEHQGAWAAAIIASTSGPDDPLEAVMLADRVWQAQQREQVRREEAAWRDAKRREHKEASRFFAELPS